MTTRAHVRPVRTLMLAPALLAMLAGASAGLPTAWAQNIHPSDVAKAAERKAARATASNEALPITQITLYRSGVGLFLRQGEVSGDTNIELKFDVAQINDVLKSLQVLDKGGRVESVSYPSKDPLSHRLASFGLQIGDNPSLSTLLGRLRGSTVTLNLSDSKVEGAVLSVESIKMPVGVGDKATVVDTQVVNLVTPGGIRAVPIPSIVQFQIADKALADELNRALLALSEARAERTKTLDVILSGQGSRPAAVAYVHETPVWKTSYRLLLSDDAAKGEENAKGSGLLQGWALVENTTDNDWSNVKLSLVSGRPVSFRMDLFQPLYAFRPEVAVPVIAGVMPRAFEGGVSDRPAEAARPAAMGAPGSPGGGGGGMAVASRAPRIRGEAGSAGFDDKAGAPAPTAGLAEANFADYGAKAVATGSDVGETFQFTVDAPVTIERQRSAMIPILNANLTARRVSIFNMSDRADHPMRGVQITNTSGGQLLPGPLSVYDGNSYAGDAQVNQVAPGDQRLIAFAVDLDVAVQTDASGGGTLSRVRIVDGTMESTVVETQAMKYTFDNKDLNRPRTIIVEHPKLEGWTLKSDIKPEESTQSLHRIAIDLDAGKKSELKVSQERTVSHRVGIFDYDLASLTRFSAEGKISPAALGAMRELFAKQTAVSEQERLIGEMDKQLATLKTDQSRLSGMVANLGDRTSDTYRNLIAKVNKQESEIDALTARRGDASKALELLRKALNDAVRGLNVD
jgi:hypothetical protein